MEYEESNIPTPAPSETIRAEQYNMRNPSVKRIMAEARELGSNNEEFAAQPLEENIFEWHFTFRGSPDSDFETGIYHGRIILPPDYPMNPPAFIMLTPNGRFEVGKKICLSISSYHPETWRPCWSIRTAVAALVAFMNQSSPGAIGSIECNSEQRRAFARRSIAFVCPECGLCSDLLPVGRPTTPEIPANNAQRVFRIPHARAVLHDSVIPPEVLTLPRNGEDIVPPPLPTETGDIPDQNEEIDEFLEWQINAGGIHVDAAHVPEPIEIDNSPMFGITAGVIIVAIIAILFRRLVWNTSWNDIFGLE